MLGETPARRKAREERGRAEKSRAELREKKERLLSELETQIKVSNATTLIEF